MNPRRKWLVGLGLLAVTLFGCVVYSWLRFPSDRTPRGAYFRVVIAVNGGKVEGVFPYLETAAQHAAFTIHGYVSQSRTRILQAYPEAEQAAALSRLPQLTDLEAGPGVFAWYAAKYGWIDRLRRDLSGVQSSVEEGDRATVETIRGTRYAFRKRENGMWGLTLFTARLVNDAEKAARDLSVIDAAARDYERSRGDRAAGEGLSAEPSVVLPAQ